MGRLFRLSRDCRPRSAGVATDLAEEQRGMAQRCGTEAAEDWGLTRHDLCCINTFENSSKLEFLEFLSTLDSSCTSSSNLMPSLKFQSNRSLFRQVSLSILLSWFFYHLLPLSTFLQRRLPFLNSEYALVASCRTVHPQVPSGNHRVSRMFGP